MEVSQHDATIVRVFVGDGEMAARCRAFDWASTSLGAVDGWTYSLRALVSTLLASRQPMVLSWGPDLIQIYNDAYRPTFGEGGGHPRALGSRGADFWAATWDDVGPQIARVMTLGEATWHVDQLVPIDRNGQIEDAYFTYGFSPAYDDDGSIGGTLVTAMETTRRVLAIADRDRAITAERTARAEAVDARDAMQRVFSQAPVAIAVLSGREMLYTVANASYCRLIGDRDPVGRRVMDIFPELAGSEMEVVRDRVFDTGLPFVAKDLLVHFDSQGAGAVDNYYDLVDHPITENGAVTGIVVVAVDVTERHHMLVERQRLLDLAERAKTDAELANRAKGEFLAVMSHELRTPLNAIGGYAELIEMGIRGPVTNEQRADLARIQMSQRHLLGLINGVLNYTKIEAGVVQYAKDDVYVDEVLNICEALTAPQVRAKQLTLNYEAEDRALVIRGDAEKLQQIVLNLLANAIKFTEPGGRITLRLRADGNEVAVDVTDTGRGIAPANAGRVFDQFVQVDARLIRTGEGVGLGLAISRDLARGMGGSLAVVSVLGEGSTFMLALPRSGMA
jgi:signal transduction histidine kinase